MVPHHHGFHRRLPRSEGKNYILVVVEKLTKYAHFLPLTYPFTLEQVVKVFLNNIYRLHGLPLNIVSDRDKIFTSEFFWKELFKPLGTELSDSTAYHPQTDTQTERVNQCLEAYLRCMTQQGPRQWTKWISLAKY
ncbi:UNVERIFIED_CONTAM: hypothetical protein Sradi_0882800 [Sesamum radiatum]|uniref:Integrase catalytic domain-containing protein n=1 Tax=Sesamum radiatum TaxID=300843 RepID=A0AAW2V4A5_SESRA